ncbi:hypothetical protein [Methylorubrum sp. SB2]|uniref:hypothetical protein n=1 Tax=Methylorubrum subtropicum TaxID=3138812 RepID=UPI00313C3C5D
MNIPPGLLSFQTTRSLSDSSDEDRIVTELADLKRRPDDPVAADLAADILLRAASPKLRNAAALALADLDARGKVADIVSVLRRPGIGRSAGTLLFALGELEGTLPILVAARLIAEGSFEARAETLTLLEDCRIDASEGEAAAEEARRLLADLASSDDAETAEAAALALDYITSSRPGL